MNKPVFRVVGLDQATCEAEYVAAETTTKPASIEMLKLYTPPDSPLASKAPEPTGVTIHPSNNVTVRVRDIMPALQQSSGNRLAWVTDFADDPVVITRDLYDVLLTFQRMNRAA